MTSSSELPSISAAEAFADQQFFAEHPGRRSYVRSGPDGAVWAIRRRGHDVFLRSPAKLPGPYRDSETAAETVWWLAAWPDLTPEARVNLAKAARTSRQRGAAAPGVPSLK